MCVRCAAKRTWRGCGAVRNVPTTCAASVMRKLKLNYDLINMASFISFFKRFLDPVDRIQVWRQLRKFWV